MHKMKQVVWLLAIGAASLAAQRPQLDDTGTFTITEHGQVRGTEHFSLRRALGGLALQSRIEYQIGDRRVQQTAVLQLDAGDGLNSYRWNEGRAQIDVGYSDGKVTAHYQPAAGTPQDFQFVMPNTTAVLDTNFYSQWEMLAARYDRIRGGAQQFPVFVPHTGDPGKITLTVVPGPGLYHLRAESDDVTLDLFFEGSRLERLDAPDLVVTRGK